MLLKVLWFSCFLSPNMPPLIAVPPFHLFSSRTRGPYSLRISGIWCDPSFSSCSGRRLSPSNSGLTCSRKRCSLLCFLVISVLFDKVVHCRIGTAAAAFCYESKMANQAMCSILFWCISVTHTNSRWLRFFFPIGVVLYVIFTHLNICQHTWSGQKCVLFHNLTCSGNSLSHSVNVTFNYLSKSIFRI